MNFQLFVLSFLFGLLVYGDEILSDKCIILDLIRVDFSIQCGSSHDNATTLIEALNTKVNESVVRLSITGVGIDKIPNNLSDILPNVTTLKLGNPPSTKYEICTGKCTSKFYNIERLELINMNISEMEFTTPHPNLKDLRIFGGEMAQLDKSFGTKLPNLEWLIIIYSKLSSLGVIKNICSLRHLLLDENNITSLDIDNATCFQNLIGLTLYGNAIDSVTIDPSAVSQLKYLLMDFHGDLNQLIKSLNLPELTSLSVRKSNSKIFNASNLEKLPKLKGLYFEDGKLERVPMGNQQTKENILILSLANNNINIVNESDFVGWTNLRQLYLNQNNIKNLSSNSFSKLISLWFLDLSNNFMTESYTSAFLGLPSSTTVFLGGNPVTTIPPSILAPLTSNNQPE
ncbi:hypothetical protein ACOME3_001481 [Neoechinorhynchus agilis]